MKYISFGMDIYIKNTTFYILIYNKYLQHVHNNNNHCRFIAVLDKM